MRNRKAEIGAENEAGPPGETQRSERIIMSSTVRCNGLDRMDSFRHGVRQMFNKGYATPDLYEDIIDRVGAFLQGTKILLRDSLHAIAVCRRSPILRVAARGAGR